MEGKRMGMLIQGFSDRPIRIIKELEEKRLLDESNCREKSTGTNLEEHSGRSKKQYKRKL
jgi:hypothetical protein